MLDAHLRARHLDGHDVEADGVRVQVMACDVMLGNVRYPVLLGGRHGLEGASRPAATAGADLAEDDGGVWSEGDHVDLARAATEVALHDDVAAGAEKCGGDRLAFGAAPQAVVRHGVDGTVRGTTQRRYE